MGGGGTNTAVSFSRQGLKTGYLGVIGNDLNGKEVKKCLNTEKIEFLGKTEGETGYSVILDSKAKDRTILTYKGGNNLFNYSKINKNKLKTKWFYFSSMMNASLESLKQLAIFANKNKINVAFNPSQYLVVKGIKELEIILKNSNILIMNKKESELLTKETDSVKILKKLKKYAKDYVVITDGANGVQCYDGKKLYYAPARKDIKIVETTGAGDAFSSAFTAGILKKEKIDYALKRGMIQAEQIIQHYGAKGNLLKEKNMIKLLNKDDRKISVKSI